MNYKVLGVSSGLGVTLFPFKNQLIGNIECRGLFHTSKDEQWRANFSNIPLYKEDKNLTEESLIERPDIIISSPDCGSGSILRYSRAKQLGDHKKNHSLMLFFVAVRKYQPKLFLFENLDGLFKSFPKERFLKLLSNYRLIEHNASVAHWGNSQKNRKRLVIVGVRRDLPRKIDKYFKLPHYKNPKTCHELYGDITLGGGPSGNVREHITETISIYGGKRMTLGEIRDNWRFRLKHKKRYYVPEEEGRKFKTAPGVYRNLSHDFPATARKANRQYDHNGLTLTPRQLARVQGVPDEFVLYINPDKLGYWINKARTTVTKTPPYEIALWFKLKLEKSKHLWGTS